MPATQPDIIPCPQRAAAVRDGAVFAGDIDRLVEVLDTIGKM